MNSLNVLMISTDFPPLLGGISTYARQIAQHLTPFCNVIVVAPRFYKRGGFPEKTWNSFTVVRACDLLLIRELHILYLSMKALRRINGQAVLFATTWFPSGIIAYCLWQLFGLPYYLGTHASDILDDKNSWRRRIKYRFRFLKHFVFERANGIFAVSYFTSRLLQSQGVPREKIHIVHNGADLNLFRPLKIDKDIRRKYGIEERRVVLSVCRLDPHKGIDLMLRTMQWLCHEFPDLIYVVIGSGPEHKRLVTLAESLGIKDRVRFLGYVQEDEVALWYNLCDIYVMLSQEIPGRTDLMEGFGISFVEAAACGKPTIACRFGGVTDAIKDGETGVLIDVPPKINEVVNVVARLLRSETLRRELGQAGRRRVERDLNWELAAAQYFRVFRAGIESSSLGKTKRNDCSF